MIKKKLNAEDRKDKKLGIKETLKEDAAEMAPKAATGMPMMPAKKMTGTGKGMGMGMGPLSFLKKGKK